VASSPNGVSSSRQAGVLAAEPVPLDPAGSVLGDAAVAAAAGDAPAGRRSALAVSPWEPAAVVTMGSDTLIKRHAGGLLSRV
jgi:hypothetical protein